MKPTDPQPEALAAPLEPRGLNTIREALGLFRSIALCGEEVSPRAEAIMAEALKELARLEAAQPPSAMTEPLTEHSATCSECYEPIKWQMGKGWLHGDGSNALGCKGKTKPAEPHTLTREPDGYAYRYADKCIRFNHGEMVNGGKPTGTIPYFLGNPAEFQALTREQARKWHGDNRVRFLMGEMVYPRGDSKEKIEYLDEIGMLLGFALSLNLPSTRPSGEGS